MKKPAIISIKPENKKVYILYFDKYTNHGVTCTIDASAAPAPMVTSNAGRAQHSSVDSEVNKLKVGRILFLSTFTPVDLNNIISRIGN